MATPFLSYNRLRKRLTGLLMALAVLIAATALWAPSAKAADVLFSHRDPKGDDKGPGRYVYPKNRVFGNGTFDIRNFEVLDLGSKIEFRITIDGNIIREHEGWREASGWVLQLMDIYIDKDRKLNSGVLEALPGRGVLFEPSSAWDQVIVVTPRSRERVVNLVDEFAEEMELMLIGKKLVIPSYPKTTKRTFIARVSKQEIGSPQPWWGYQVLMMGHNDSDAAYTFMNKEVNSFAREMEFGGGTDFRGDPNVIDILDGAGQLDQYQALSRYKSKPDPRFNTYAVIKHIYHAEKPDNIDQAKTAGPGPGARKRPIKTPSIKNIPAGEVAATPVSQTREPGQQAAVDGKLLEEDEFPVDLLEDTPAGKCTANMVTISRAASTYYRHYPEDENITMLDLIYENYLDEKPSCPSGGRYVIYGEDSGKIMVRCINPTGVEHGIFPRPEEK